MPTLGCGIVSGGGGRSVKSNNRETAEFGLTGALSTDIPDKPRFRLRTSFAFLAGAALFGCAAFGLSQSAQAEGAFTIAGINSTLPSWSPAAKSEESSQPRGQIADDSVISALTSFATQIGAAAPKPTGAKASDSQFDDRTYAALRSFALSMDTVQPQSIKDQTKLAQADNLMDWLAGKGAEAPAAKPSKGPLAGGKTSKAPVEAHFVGVKVCLTCHATQAAEFQKTLMGRIGKTQKGKFDCENCHGPGSAHAKAGGGRGVGGIVSFRPNDLSRTAEENNGVCLACHEHGDRTLWQGSIHQTRGLMCTNCHTIMKAVSRKYQLKTEAQPDTCFQCHKDIRAKLSRSSHMPVLEGKLVCTNCHNPHGSYTEKLLKEATVNEVCFQCHAEKRGPFLWEHPPVVENCLNCHDPHGTINDNLLKWARPRLCQRCHNAANNHPANPRNPMSIFAVNSGCANCHSQIHGSNSPGGQFFHR